MTIDIYELLSRTAAQVLVPPLDLEALQSRAQRRLRVRNLIVVASVFAVVLVVSLASILVNGSGPSSSREPIAPRPTVGSDAYTNGMWPFTSESQAAAWRADPAAMPWAGDKAQVVQHYVADVLHLPSLRVDSLGCPECFEQHITDDAGILAVDAAIVGDPTGPFSIANIIDVQSVFDLPLQFGQIGSPIDVSGHSAETLGQPSLQLVASDGRLLAAMAAPGETAVLRSPAHNVAWSFRLTWAAKDWTKAGLVAVTRGHLGEVTALAMLPVTNRG